MFTAKTRYMHTRYPLVLATRNTGKVREMEGLLTHLPLHIHTVRDFPDAPTVEEDARTLRGNALKKAEALFIHTGFASLADDTGLEVDALDGRPGVHSARFAGLAATDAENRSHLLAQLDGQANRSARFRTVVALVEHDGTHCFEGVCEGHILDTERGQDGFGYDALFQPAGYDRTFAELSRAEKNAISHRGQAVRAFVDFISRRYTR
ncbi:MAG: RdgB/HAM1 family non-canonical purine NTP pyrophosphatase [Bacteroidota bacterium]